MTAGIVKKGSGTLVLTSLAEGKEYGNVREYFAGNTTMEAGTIEYALASGTGSYSGTISGTGNVAKSGAGSVTLANVSNLEGSISVTEGALNITSLSTDKTMNVSVSSGSLSIGSVVLNPDTMALSAKEGATATQYYSMDGGATKNSEGNGFLYTSGDYVLFNGYVWNGSLDNGLTVSDDGTNTYVTAETRGTTYYLTTATADINATEIGADTYAVRGGTMNIVGTMNSSDIQYTSGGVTLANADSTLVLDSADNAATLLATTTGEAGKIKVAVDTTLQSASTQAKGNLTINKDKTLQVGTGNSATTNISSFSSVTLDGGTLFLKGASQTVHALTVEQAATLKVSNWGAAIQTYTLDNLTTLNANLTITSESNEKGKVVINELTGSKDIFVSGGHAGNGPVGLTIKKLTDYTGTINVDGGNRDANRNYVTITSEGDISLKGLNLTNKGLADLSGVVGTKNLGTVVIDASSSLALSGAIGNMAASGAGTLSMAAGTTTSGTVSIANALTIGGTIANTGSFTLFGNVTIADIHALKNNTIYSDNEGKDGYISSAIYYVVESSGSGSATASEGLLLNGTHTLTAENGNLVARVENETPGGIYYVNTRDFTVDGTDTNAAKYATGYYIAADKTLTLAGNQSDSMTAGKILSEATGEGNIELNTNASYSDGVASQAEGKLTINGVKLSVGRGTVNYITDGSNISSFSSVDLKGGTLILNGSGSTINSLTVSEGTSTLTVMNENGGHQEFTLSGTTTLNADLDIDSGSEHGTVIMKKLTGSKNLSIAGGHQTWGCTAVQIEKLTNYTGTITVDNDGRTEVVDYSPKYTHVEFGTSNGEAAFSTLKGLEIKGNAYALVHAKANSTIDSLTLDNGSLKYKTNYGPYTYTLSNVVVKNTGTIAIESNAMYYEGEVTIKNLKNAEGETSGELTLSSNFKDDKANVFNLEDGDFSGKIIFESQSEASANSKRYHALNINDQDVASKAVIEIKDDNNSSHMGLALGADKVIVKGISGAAENAAIYSGAQDFQAKSFTSDDNTARTLEIATAGESYTSSAAIKKNVNLVKSGEGTQTFTSDSIASTSIAVNGGVLALTGLAELQLQDLVVKSGATLSVGNVVATVDEGSSNQTTPSTSVSKTATLHGGATINSSLDLSKASSLTLNGIGKNSLVMINGDLILPVASETPTLTLSGDILSSLNAMNQGDELGIFSVRGGFFVGDLVTETLNATYGIALNTVFSAGEGYNFEDYYLGFYNIPDEAGYSTVYIGKIVPEPTTATLSLLALAALAARRRRR
ncbi:MAG: hypothetical protein IJB33_07690 [Akkermansia sp.]|nr:hypothetical protein [Akkermansia sp.]